MSQPIASVIVSTRNRAEYLPDLLGSLARQQCEAEFEVVLVDNGSTDGTSAVLHEWCRKHTKFRVAFEPRLGLSCGKNAGIRLARAPLLLFTDDDVITEPGWVQAYIQLCARCPDEVMLAGGPQIPVPHDLGSWPRWFDPPSLADIALLNYGEQRALNKHEYVWGANMAVPRHVFDRFGCWNENIGRKGDARGTFEDTEFQDRVRAAGGVVWFCTEATIRHRVPRETITPRRISSTAFARGRNEVWIKNIPVWGDVRSIPKRNLIIGLLRLAAAVVQWSVWGALFRLFRRPQLFERTRQAAFATGHSLDSLRTGRDSVRLYLAVGRIAFGVRALLLRLSPDVA